MGKKWAEMTSRERDECIHERVMGKQVYCPGAAVTEMVKNPSRIQGEYFEYLIWGCSTCGESGSGAAPERHKIPRVLLPYSGSMGCAWMVVHHLAAILTYDQSKRFMRALITLEDTCEEQRFLPALDFDHLAKLTPEWICQAALKALEISEDEHGKDSDIVSS